MERQQKRRQDGGIPTEGSYLLQLIEAVIRDISIKTGINLTYELEYLTGRTLHEGTRFLLNALPELDSALLRGLELGIFQTPTSFRLKGGTCRLPKFCFRLLHQVFQTNGVIRGDASPQIVKCLRQLFTVVKKVELEAPIKLREQSLKDCLSRDEALLPISRLLSNTAISASISEVDMLEIIKLSRKLLSRALRSWDPHDIKPRVSSGATTLNDTFIERYHSIYHTYSGQLQSEYPWESFFLPPGGRPDQFTTLGLPLPEDGSPLFYSPLPFKKVDYDDRYGYIKSNPYGLELVTNYLRRSYDGVLEPDKHVMGSTGALRLFADNRDPQIAKEQADIFTKTLCSRVIDIPKSATQRRIIGLQPPAFIALQKGQQQSIYHCLEKRSKLTRGHINFTDQTINRRLALRASKEGRLATIDIRNASDSVSLDMVKRLFSSCWDKVQPLLATRVGYASVVWPDESISYRRLKRWADMGSATTFPIEALVFWALSVSAPVVLRKVKLKDAISETYVYGDDIISPYYMEVVRTLDAFGFEISPNKCFWLGDFRESCGCDAFKGVDVTPIKITKTCHDLFADTPNFRQLPVGTRRDKAFEDYHRRLKATCDQAALAKEKGFDNLAEFLYSEVESSLGMSLPLGCKGASYLCRLADIDKVLHQSGVIFYPNEFSTYESNTGTLKVIRTVPISKGMKLDTPFFQQSGAYYLKKVVWTISAKKQYGLNFPIRNYWEALCCGGETSSQTKYDESIIVLRKQHLDCPIHIT